MVSIETFRLKRDHSGSSECINTHLVTNHGTLLEDVHEQDHLVAKADVIQLIRLRHHVPPPTLAGAAACVIRGRPCDGFLHHSVPIDINLLVNKNKMSGEITWFNRDEYLNITVSIAVFITTVDNVIILIIADKVLEASLLIILLLLLITPLLGQLQDEGVVPDPRQLLDIIEQASLLSSFQLSFVRDLTKL